MEFFQWIVEGVSKGVIQFVTVGILEEFKKKNTKKPPMPTKQRGGSRKKR